MMKPSRFMLLLGALGLVLSTARFAPGRNQANRKNESDLIKPEAIRGCYELGELNWRPSLSLGEDKEFITPPSRIQLLDEHGSQGFETNGYLVRPAPRISPTIHRASYWVPKGPKTIEIVWTTGLSGLTMTLDLEGETLEGKAKTHWDFPRRSQTAKVTAHKVECGK